MQTSVFAAQYHEASDSSKKSKFFFLFLPLAARGRKLLLIPASVLKVDAAGGGDEADLCPIHHEKLTTQEWPQKGQPVMLQARILVKDCGSCRG